MAYDGSVVACGLIRLSALWRRSGYIYAAESDAGPMQHASAGAIVRNPDDRPPWIVVDHSLETVVIASWPGRLWRARVHEAAYEQLSTNFRRAVSVRILEELPVSVLFGPHGREVCAVIDRAAALTFEEIEALASAYRHEARAAYSRAWQAWLGQTGEDHGGTLAIPLRGRERSPVGSGFTVLHSVISEKAYAHAGTDAFTDDEDGTWLVPPWSDASSAALQAAMAFGAPQLVSADDAKLLTEAWTTCMKS
ncbi:MAG TPA: hypothetical protein VKB93_15450 [Thermoanaerobaculia bacterium]|nr:hypothetical protein [Thermoanaerobaculia bacterium]